VPKNAQFVAGCIDDRARSAARFLQTLEIE